jgi:putative restriction endonuclease
MAFGLFIHRADSIYDDNPAEKYQFPRQYLDRANACVGDWIIYYEPQKVPRARGYYAVAKVEQIIPDPTAVGMYLALMVPGSYLEFANSVPYSGPDGRVERGVHNAQWAIRPMSADDFNRITALGLVDDASFLPRQDDPAGLADASIPYGDEIERDRMSYIASRIIRDRVFRRVVLRAYDSKCALTGLRLINGGGRAEVAAAHIKPVAMNGPDIVNNGLALCGTMHWMFDRGLVGLSDDLEILLSRQLNDSDGVRGMINRNGRAMLPQRVNDRPHPTYLAWHRQNCFKH